ncbi:MAG: glycosyltransferase family 4 protein [Saccharospirillaceae bacterium]|nr:glycosyltransferase family 4 protein [Saccharospirillaceae bacterium]
MRILYLVNCSYFFNSHFIKLAEASLAEGHTVYIASGNDVKRTEFEEKGFIYLALPLSRGGTNIKDELNTIVQIYKVLKSVKPDLLHMLTVKPIIYGGLINRLFKSCRANKSIASITGLGSASLSTTLKGKLLWKIIVVVYKFVLSLVTTKVIFENEDDQSLFLKNKIISSDRAYLVNGAGIDTSVFVPGNTENQSLKVVLVARLLKDKGIQEYISAGEILQHRGCNVTLQLVGSVDKFNISSMNEADITYANNQGYVEYLGQRSDISYIYKKADIACLPSYREGLSKSLIEAASSGLAIITTNVPGCRQMVSNDNGILVPAKDAYALADAIEYMIKHPDEMKQMGAKSRVMAVNKFDSKIIINEFFKIYELPLTDGLL